MKYCFTLFITLFIFQMGISQLVRKDSMDQAHINDIVYLVDGSILKGKLVSWELGDELIITIASGSEITIPANMVKKVRQESYYIGEKHKIRKSNSRDFNFRNTGLYNNLALSLAMGSELGVSLTYSLGYRFSHLFGVGLGTGIEDFELGSASQVIPIFAEVRGYTSKKSISPYYSIRGGYGVPLTNDKFRVIDGKGGLMFHPEAGFRFGGHNAWFYMGAGLRFQNITYVREIPWWQEGTATDKISFKRIDIKFGLEF